MTKALVTGAHGFIGSALCRRLLASRVEVHAVSRNPPADAQHAARGTMIQWWNADLIELDAARELIEPFGRTLPSTWQAVSQVRGASTWSYRFSKTTS